MSGTSAAQTDDDAKEDLELTDENADQVRGGLVDKLPNAAPDATWK